MPDVEDGRRPRSRIAGLAFLLFVCLPGAAVQGMASDGGPRGLGILVSPRAVRPGDTVRVLAVSETPIDRGRILVQGPSSGMAVSAERTGGGPPFWWKAEFQAGAPGSYSISLGRRKEPIVSRRIEVGAGAGSGPGPVKAGEPPAQWDLLTENFYSAWLEALFSNDDERSSWKALHDVIRDPGNNVLYDRLGRGEDDPAGAGPVIMEPDCADAPYFLRAYFAWKLGLPFGYRTCSRGSLSRAPRCPDWTAADFGRGAKEGTRAFNRLLNEVKNAIHSGTGRTLLEDEASDYYPVALARERLRPGIVFADPYGHTLILVRWLPQAGQAPGELLAMDAQPDGTIGLRRFWRGNFLFETREVIGNPGFKAFRPIHRAGGRLEPLGNDEILRSPDYGGLSLEQKNMAPRTFYDRMQKLINPEPLDPAAALRDLETAFYEQLLTRVISVSNAEDHLKAHPGTVVPMPASAAGVFQDLGDWENFSTPNRDMRLLIAMDVLRGFPEEVVRTPGSYRVGGDAGRVRQELEAGLDRWARETTFSYTRSDGKPQVLSVADIFNRAAGLEVAYNPNDCVELRWGAAEGSPERAACGRRAPAYQRQRMEALRRWFHERRRPAT